MQNSLANSESQLPQAASPPAAPSLLDSKATSIPKPPSRCYRDLCLAPVQAEHDATASFYATVDSSAGKLYSARLSACRTSAWFAVSEHTRIVRAASRTCRLRWCPMCAKVKANFASHSVTQFLEIRTDARFLTLTLRHSTDPLASQVTRLYDSFRRLRRLPEFQLYVTGGVWFFQVKLSPRSGTWHPHIHCLVTGDFFPKARLSALWHHITHDSMIVDIKRIKDTSAAAKYVSRYSARPASLQNIPRHQHFELYQAFVGRRLAGTWGTCRPLRLTPPRAQPGDTWRKIGSWSLITNLARDDPRALSIWQSYIDRTPLPPELDLTYLDSWLDDSSGSDPASWLPDTYIDEMIWRPP